MSVWNSDIASLHTRISDVFGFRVLLCAEIECTVLGLESLPHEDMFWQPVCDALRTCSVDLESIGREEGAGQYEFRLKPTEPLAAAEALERLKVTLLDVAASFGLNVSFVAKPSPTEPGNGLHWHLHLENASGMRVFFKQEEQLSPPLNHALGGLLHTMPALMPIFAPTTASYARFEAEPDHVPQTISWGGNNRTVALRLPESVIPMRHIEHRVAGADAHPHACVWALLVGVADGLANKREAGEQQFGNANRNAALPRLPLTLEDAKAQCASAQWVDEYLPRAELLARLDATG